MMGLFLVFMPPLFLSTMMPMILYRRVLVSNTKIQTTKADNFTVPLSMAGDRHEFFCSSFCLREVWCNLFCSHFPDEESCYLSEVIVMPTYIEDPLVTPPTLLTCYTKRPLDLATYAYIIAGEQNYENPRRVKENLVDGIYTFKQIDGFTTENNVSECWFELDLGDVMEFSNVVMVAEHSTLASLRMLNVEVRVGVEAVPFPPDFTEYKFFGHYPGPASMNEEIIITLPSPVFARYISFQKLEDNGQGFCLGHVQVF